MIFEKNREEFLNTHQGLPQWVKELNENAWDHFTKNGLPHKKQEDFKFTNLEKVFENNYRLPQKNDFKHKDEFLKYCEDEKNLIVYVDGVYSEELSKVEELKEKAEFHTLQRTFEKNCKSKEIKEFLQDTDSKDFFHNLNLAFFAHGCFLTIPEKVEIKKTINIIYVTTEDNANTMKNPHNFIYAGKHSRASIMESYLSFSNNKYLMNSVTDIYLEAGSHIGHTKVQNESLESFHFSAIRAKVQKDAHFKSFVLNSGAKLSRNILKVDLLHEGAECAVDGLYVLKADQQNDNYTQINHQRPHTESSQLYKGILSGKSKAVFNGKVVVEKHAHSVNSNQLNKNLILSKTAKVNTQPTLLIDNDDVKCAHGATIGQIDEEQVFYLLSRGFNEQRARILLAHAFGHDVINKIGNKFVREKVSHIIEDKLDAAAKLLEEEN